ncbi:MAG: Nif3-like dinuclear metal center hexameric protein [Candidatus Odinarchaeia archaeon]
MSTLYEVIQVLNRIAPPDMADPEDKIGLQIGPLLRSELMKKTVRKITVALDPSFNAIKRAIENKSQLLITHHPLFWDPLYTLNGELLKKIRLITNNYLNLFVVHTNWDSAENGTNDTILAMLGLNKIGVFDVKTSSGKSVPLGRVCKPTGTLMNLRLLLEIIQDKLSPKQLNYIGDLKAEVNLITVITGMGGSIKFLKKALEMGVDTFITGEASYHAFKYAEENNLNLISVGHFETENPGMRRMAQILQLELRKIKIDFFESKPVKNIFRT